MSDFDSPKSIQQTKNTNPNKGFSTSGGAESGPNDWFVFLQTVDIMYVRQNLFNAETSSTLTSPAVTSNFLEMNCTVQTQGDVYRNVSFSSADSSSGDLFEPQILQLQSNAASGGFGQNGVVSTSAMGVIRRPVRKDAAGNIIDTTGICTQNVTVIADQMPGAYNETLDTSGTVNAVLASVMGQLAQKCPEFKPTLVDL